MFGDSTFAEVPFATLAVQTILVALVGVQSSGSVSTVYYFYWSVIDNSQVPNWQNVAMTV
jgi:hypothetical protein